MNEHTMHTVMQAVLKARAEGDRPLPVLTSNQCHALAQELNKELSCSVERTELRSHLERMIGQAEYMLELAENSFDSDVDEDDGSFDECREYIEQARAALEPPK